MTSYNSVNPWPASSRRRRRRKKEEKGNEERLRVLIRGQGHQEGERGERRRREEMKRD